MLFSRFTRPVSARARLSRAARIGLLLCATALAAGCQTRNAADVTGSIGRGAAASATPNWTGERDQWGKRYEANPRDREAAFRYARALRALDQNAQALAVLQGAVLVHTNDTEMLGAYGRSLADNGRLREADEVLGRAHSPERPDWRILSAQGTVADQLGDHARAQKIYRAALQIAPAEATILSNLGLSFALSKRLPEAERTLREAAAAGGDARVRQNLVLVLGLQGRFAEAETLARQDQGPEEAKAGIAYLKRTVSQPNSWDMLRGGATAQPKPGPRKPAQPGPAVAAVDQAD